MKKVLITGATGFVGKHLTDYLFQKSELELYGTSLSESDKNEKIHIKKIDLTDLNQVKNLINEIKPDYVYNLAALTSPAESFKNPAPVVLSNIGIQINLLNALKDAGLMDTRTLIVSSSEVYGMVEEKDLPIDEETPMRPVSPYAVSKIAQDFMGLQYNLSYKMDIVRVRPFNHTGPGQTPVFVIPAFAKQIAQIEKGIQEAVISVGNLSSKRDFTDVRDIVQGYQLLTEKGVGGEAYNIGSGKSVAIKYLLDTLLSMSKESIEVRQDPERLLPVEIPSVYCDNSKINSLTGWKPEISIEKTLKDTLDYWRSVV